MRFSQAILVTLALAAGSSPALAEGPLPGELAASEDAIRLNPISDWVVDYGDDYCRLHRFFGSEEDKHLLAFEQFSPASSFSLIAAGSEVKFLSRRSEISLGLERDRPMREDVPFAAVSYPTLGPALDVQFVPLGLEVDGEPVPQRIDSERASMVDRVVLKKAGKVLSFETGNMQAALEALNQCSQDFYSVWGLDADKHVGHTTPTVSNEERYARRLLRRTPSNADSGTVALRLIVEADGRISDCHAFEVTSSEDLADLPCKDVDTLEFEPATDANGDPMRSFYVFRLTHVIE